MRGVCYNPETIFQLTEFGTWKSVDLMYHPSGLLRVTGPTTLCAPLDAVVVALKHTMSYLRRFFEIHRVRDFFLCQ